MKQQIGSINSLIEDSSSTMKAPRKVTYRRTLPKVVGLPLKDQNRVLTINSAGTCPISKTTPLKPLVDHHTSRSTDTCKSIKVKTRHLNQISKINPLLSQLKYATDGMEAFIILFQRLTTDTDVFALPLIKEELSNYKKEWLDMKLKLEEANVSYKRLKEEIDVQRLLHEQKLEELRGIHMAQLDRLKEFHVQELAENSNEYEKRLNDLRSELENQEHLLLAKFNGDVRSIQKEAEQKLESILEETKNQVEFLKIENDAWKEKLTKESWKKLQEVEKKYKSKMDRMETNYANQLNEADKEARKREEIFLQPTKKKPASHYDSVHDSSSEIGKLSLESLSSYGSRTDFQNLEEEICSLRTVLDLKHSEIQDLRKQNEKLRKDTQDLPFVMQKLDSAQARVEDLSAQLMTKTENEKKLLKENRRLLETVHHETEKKKRLTFQNEELLWKLKKSTQVAKTLAVFNSSRNKEERGKRISESDAMCYHSTPLHSNHHVGYSSRNKEKYLKRSRTDADIKLIESPTDGDVSPKVLGVVEKSDSVSWVLEIDESPLAVASRMLRRANSLRGVPSKIRTNHNLQSLTLPTRNKKSSTNASCSTLAGESDFVNSNASTSAPKTDDVDDDDRGEKNVDATKPTDDDENAITDIASFFEFLQDSDFETDPATSDDADVRTAAYYAAEKGSTSPFSNISSDSSLDIDSYDSEMKSLPYARFTWTNDVSSNRENRSNVTKKNVTDSSSVSDSEESESAGSFPSSAPETEETAKSAPS